MTFSAAPLDPSEGGLLRITPQLGVTCSAYISADTIYRYWLLRSWDARLRRVCFICLNPSTADAHTDDPTLVKVQTYARLWGYGSVTVVNLFAYRATDPAELGIYTRAGGDPVGPLNFDIIEREAKESALVVCAWGKGGEFLNRAAGIVEMLHDLKCAPHALRLNKDGSPAHPLYLPFNLKPFPMETSA